MFTEGDGVYRRVDSGRQGNQVGGQHTCQSARQIWGVQEEIDTGSYNNPF